MVCGGIRIGGKAGGFGATVMADPPGRRGFERSEVAVVALWSCGGGGGGVLGEERW